MTFQIKTKVRRSFDRGAANYHDQSDLQRRIVDAVFEQASISVNRGMHVLDVGCGTGYALSLLKEKAVQRKVEGSVFGVGLDLSETMVAATAKNVAGVKGVVGDAEALPFANDCFDLSLCTSVAQWCELSKVAQELVRVTKPGGTLVLSTFVDGTLREWRELWGLESKRFSTGAELGRLACGLSIANARIESRDLIASFSSFSDAVASVRDIGAGVELSQTTSKGLMGRQHFQAVREKIERTLQEQGEIRLPYKVAILTATKAVR